MILLDLAYNISYGIAGLILMGVNIFVVCTAFKINNTATKKYLIFCVAIFVGELLDILTVITISYADLIPVWFNYLINSLYFMMAPLALFTCERYVQSTIKKSFKVLNIANYILAGLYTLLIILNVWTKWIFYFDGTTYTHGKIFWISYALIIFYVFCLCLMIGLNWNRFRKYQKISNTLFPIATVLSVLLQALAFPGIILTYFGASISATIMLFALESPDYQDLEKLRNSLEIEVKTKTKESEERRLQIETLTEQMIEALSTAVDALDKYTIGHSQRVAKYTRMISLKAGVRQDLLLRYEYAALLHDIGKIGVDRKIIKKDAKLTQEEWEDIKNHPVIGGDILKSITTMPEIAQAARYHHERYDGKGYPEGLNGMKIPEVARIITVADSYDTMSSKRPYRDAKSQAEILKEFEEGLGTQFDPVYGQIMIDIIKADKDYNLRHK